METKKYSSELEKALDDLSNKMNFIGVESGGTVLVTESNIDSMNPNELKSTLKKTLNVLTAIESHNQDAAKIIRNRIVPYLKENT